MPLATITQLEPFNINSSATFTFASTSVTANVAAGNIKTDNLLYANGSSWVFGGTPGGTNTQVQFNDSSAFGGNSQFTYNKATNVLTVGNIVANGAGITYITASNVTGQVANALVATTAINVTATSQPNISSVGTLTALTVSGLITATAGGIKVGNLQDPSGTNTLSLLNGNASILGNLSVGTGGTGNVTATYFIGNGSQLTGLPATYANSNVASYLPTYTGNITGNIITLTGNVTAINANLGNLVTSNYFSGAGNLLSNIVGGNVTGQVANALVATTSSTVTTNAQPNITSVGTLTDLTVTNTITGGNLSTSGTLSAGDATITGNLTVNGTTVTANVTTMNVKDPIIEMGGNTSGALTSNDGKDRGTLLHYYTTQAVDAFMGWDNSNAEFAFSSNVSVTSEVATFNTFGNIRAGYYLGNGSQLTSVAAVTATTVTASAQPNITSVGTLTDLSASGNVTASYFIGNGSQLTGLPATYANSNVASYLPTYTGELSPGNITSSGNVTASYFIGNGSQLTGLPATYANSNVASYLPTYTGNLSPGNLVVGASANLGAVGNVIITGGTTGQVLSTDGAGTLSWADQSGGGSSSPASPIAKVDVFTADGSGNTYTVSSTPANEDQLSVNIDGVLQLHSSFSLSGNVVTLSGTPVNGAIVEITNIASNIGATTGKAIAMAIVFGF